MKKQICVNCVMDTSDSLIQFDEAGVCDHCNNFYKNIKPNWPLYTSSKEVLLKQIEEIKKIGK